MGYSIAEFLNMEEVKNTLKFSKRYHQKVYFPEWFDNNFISFKNQVMDMASPKKPLKASDTFKIQAGYPHEVTQEQKENLNHIQRDTYSNQRNFLIPKLDIQNFVKLINQKSNIIEFSTPHDSDYIKDIRVFDNLTHPDLTIIYVVNRKAQIIASWSVLKNNGRFKVKKPEKKELEIFYELE